MTAARAAFAALVVGAVCIAFAPIFVRLSEIPPTATAFQRMLLALPLFLLLSTREESSNGSGARAQSRVRSAPGKVSTGAAPRLTGFTVLAGLFFAGDLAFWHWSLAYTSVANSTLLVNLAPVIVTLVAWRLMGERITSTFLVGMALALAGAAVLMGTSLGFHGHLLGDFLAVVTAVFYAGYILTIKQLRGHLPTASLLGRTTAVSASALLILSLIAGEDLVPDTPEGWLVVLGLAWISQFAGQGLIATALRYLPASFSSVTLLLQPVSAAMLAWAILGEAVGAAQGAGGALVILGIWLARRASRV